MDGCGETSLDDGLEDGDADGMSVPFVVGDTDCVVATRPSGMALMSMGSLVVLVI